MATGNSKAAVGKSGTNQSMILSAELEREMQQFIEKEKISLYTPEMDAIMVRMYSQVPYTAIARFINSKYHKNYSCKQISNRITMLGVKKK